MPRRRQAPPPEPEEVYLRPDDPDFEMYEFIEEIGPQIARVYVYRLPKMGNPEYLGVVAIENLRAPGGAEEWLWTEHGAGDYSMKFRGSDGKWKLQKNFRIGDRVKAGAIAPGAAGNPGAELAAQMAVMQQRSHEILLALIGRPAPPAGGDPAAMLTAVVGAFTTLRTPAPGAGDGGADWMTKARDLLDLARDVASGTPRPPAGDEEPGGGDNFWTVARDVGVKIAESVVSAARNPAPAAAPLLAIPEQTGADVLTDNLKKAIAYLKQKAILTKPPESYIDQIFDNQEEPQWSALLAAIERGATYDHLLQFDADIASNPALAAWFRVLYDGVFKIVFPAMDPGRPDGNADNAPENARTDPPGPSRPAGKKPRRGAGNPAGN